MTSGSMPCASSVRITPIWAKPRAAPPPSASPMVGRSDGGARRSDVASAPRSPFRPRPWPSNTKCPLRRRDDHAAAAAIQGGCVVMVKARRICDDATCGDAGAASQPPPVRPRHLEHALDHGIFVVAAARDRLHRGGVEQAVLDEAVVDIDADRPGRTPRGVRARCPRCRRAARSAATCIPARRARRRPAAA